MLEEGANADILLGLCWLFLCLSDVRVLDRVVAEGV